MPQNPRPNILLITTDQQRLDTLSLYHPETMVRAPHLQALARRGMAFGNAIVQNPVCIPSRACMQTGRYTREHGVNYMEQVIDDTPGLPGWEKTFMGRLQYAGYKTAAFGKIHMMPEKGFHEMQITGGKGARWTKSAGLPTGLGPLGRDYAAWLEARNPGAYEKIYADRRKPEYRQMHTAITFDLPLEDYVESWITENTLEFIGREHDQPFFAWCGFCGPHGPFDPPRPYDSMYPIGEVPLPPNYGINVDGSPREISPEQETMGRRVIANYYGLVTLIDDMVGRIMDTLEARGGLDNTLIIFTTDHGEMLGEFGRYGKGNFYDSIIRVPFVVCPPGGKVHAAASDEVVEVYDLAPTILDYARAEVPGSMSATSLRPMLEQGAPGREVALSEFMTHDKSKQGICARTQQYKYWRWSDGEEAFFDLEVDPHERNNLIHDPAMKPRIEDLRTLMIDRLMECAKSG